MNCVELVLTHSRECPDRTALMLYSNGWNKTTFGELLELAERAQSYYLKQGVSPGDTVLLLEGLTVRLYATLIALLSLGVTVVLVEPWMPIAKIEKTIQLVKPKAFISTTFGFLWGYRVRAIRNIPHWIRVSKITSAAREGSLKIEDVEPRRKGIVTFTSGTTGDPKGVVRDQGYLIQQYEILSKNLHSHSGSDQEIRGNDLCIFANFALMNLASGRGSIIVHPAWKDEALRALDGLPASERPETMTAGPAFLMKLMENAKLPSLKAAHIGGALTDCALFEKAFKQWPEAEWSHIYGGSEVEPVALTDAREAVKQSREKDFFQTLYLGQPVPEISSQLGEDGLWVAGPHVCPEYVGNIEETRAFKRKDESGVLWHYMGDRIEKEGAGWWYQGRSNQKSEDFLLEQRIYSFLQSSRSFVHRKRDTDHRWLMGENLKSRAAEIKKTFPEIQGVVEAKIYRDRRHRARIDRALSLKKGAPWVAG